jgi:hypothetical protein
MGEPRDVLHAYNSIVMRIYAQRCQAWQPLQLLDVDVTHAIYFQRCYVVRQELKKSLSRRCYDQDCSQHMHPNQERLQTLLVLALSFHVPQFDARHAVVQHLLKTPATHKSEAIRPPA